MMRKGGGKGTAGAEWGSWGSACVYTHTSRTCLHVHVDVNRVRCVCVCSRVVFWNLSPHVCGNVEYWKELMYDDAWEAHGLSERCTFMFACLCMWHLCSLLDRFGIRIKLRLSSLLTVLHNSLGRKEGK